MSMLRINAMDNGLHLHARPRAPLLPALDHALDAGSGPIIAMVHGYKYRPGSGQACPHRTIFSTTGTERRTAWPRHLGLAQGRAQDGLGLAFGWNARGLLLHDAYRRAARAGHLLAVLLGEVKARAPERPVHILAHSLGSEVAFQALRTLPAGVVSRLICLTGASFRHTAQDAMQSAGGSGAELINVTSRENDLFDFLFETLVAPPVSGDRAMGHGLSGPNIATLQLDHPVHLDALAALGHPIRPAQRRICHWSGYMRPGALRLWNDCLRAPSAFPLARIAPSPPAPRWSRLLEAPRLLPWGSKPAT